MSTSPPEVSPPPLKRRRVASILSSSLVEHPPPRHKAVQHEKSVRILSWNVNGIAPFLPHDTPSITNYFASAAAVQKQALENDSRPCLRKCLRHWAWPDLVGLQEVKIAPTDDKTQAAVRRNVNVPLDTEAEDDDIRPLYDAHFCLPRDRYNATGFGGNVYGVCTLVKRDIGDAQIRTVEWDLEGRLLVCEMSSVKLVMINVYAVNGTGYDHRNPETGKVIGTRHDRKREFHTLLASEVKGYEKNGWHVILAGDINVSRTKIDSFPQLRMSEQHVRSRADFEQKFIVQIGMIDTFRQLHSNQEKYTYRPYNKPWGAGGDRVDMILATKGLEGKIRQADILDTKEERGPSDHVPHFVELYFGV